jgi:hypothetical protein
MEKGENVVGPSSAGDAVLSQRLTEPTAQLLQTHPDAFDQTHDHPHVRQHGGLHHARFIQNDSFQVQLGVRWSLSGVDGVGGRRNRLAWLRIDIASARPGGKARSPELCFFPLRRPVVRRTPLVRTPPPMVRPATERATQVDTTCVSRMRQKPNSAVNAGHRAVTQPRMGLQDRVQTALVVLDKRLNPIVLMPVRAKREKLLDPDDKKARLSVKIAIALHTPSSYLSDAKASRGRTRIFFDYTQRATTESLPIRRNPQAVLIAQSTRTG